jgi:hypothetical protein
MFGFVTEERYAFSRSSFVSRHIQFDRGNGGGKAVEDNNGKYRTIIHATADQKRVECMRGGLVLPHDSRVPARHVILGSHAVLLPQVTSPPTTTKSMYFCHVDTYSTYIVLLP